MSNLPHDEEISLSDSENHGNISDGASDGGECTYTCFMHSSECVRMYVNWHTRLDASK